MNVAFVAHDSKKKLMQNLCIAYQEHSWQSIRFMQPERQDV